MKTDQIKDEADRLLTPVTGSRWTRRDSLVHSFSFVTVIGSYRRLVEIREIHGRGDMLFSYQDFHATYRPSK